MEQQYITSLIDAYIIGYEIKYKEMANAPERKDHYFKAKEDLPRVKSVLGFLQGVIPAGQCKTLLDVGSGRGAFLFPLLRDFPTLEVTSIDILPHRIELLDCCIKVASPTCTPFWATSAHGMPPTSHMTS